MADTKISALPASTTPLAGTEVLPIVQSGATKQVSVANLTAGRAISATSVTASTGNFVVGTSGQGIDFSATPGTGTSELLADYEEGTWTPVPTGYTEVGGAATWSGTYTKIGRIVHVTMQAIPVTSIASIQGTSYVSGLPFSVFARAVSAWSDDNRNNYGTNAIVVGQTLATSPNITATNSTIFGSATYVAT